MSKPRSGALRLLLVVPLALLSVSCVTEATSLSEPGDSSDLSDSTGSDAEQPLETAPANEAENPDEVVGLNDLETAPVIGLPAGGEAAPVEGIVAGTDSSTPAVTTAIDGLLRARLVDFATLYLSFDYRVDHADRVEGFRPLVTTGLLDELAIPIPSTLRDRLEAEQRVTEATVLEVKALDEDVYSLTTTVDDELQVLILAVDDQQLVRDVR